MSKMVVIFAALCVTVTVVLCDPFGDDDVDRMEADTKARVAVSMQLRKLFRNGNENVRKALENLTADGAHAILIRSTLISAASGYEFDVSLPHTSNEDFYVMAASTAKLCGKLNTMEKCFEIWMNGSLETANFERYRGLRTRTGERLQFFTNAVETRIENDSELSAIYKQIKTNLPPIKYFKGLQNKTAVREMGKQASKLILYKMHVKHSYSNISTENAYYVTARSVFELAKKPGKLEALQILYDRAISEVFNEWHDNVNEILNTPSVLYTKLEEMISSHPSLKVDYEVIKKEVEKSSKWKTGLFDNDLLPW